MQSFYIFNRSKQIYTSFGFFRFKYTIDSKFAEICGFTQQEIERYFKEWIDENHHALQCLEKLKITYDGIRFSEKPTTLYNPVLL